MTELSISKLRSPCLRQRLSNARNYCRRRGKPITRYWWSTRTCWWNSRISSRTSSHSMKDASRSRWPPWNGFIPSINAPSTLPRPGLPAIWRNAGCGAAAAACWWRSDWSGRAIPGAIFTCTTPSRGIPGPTPTRTSISGEIAASMNGAARRKPALSVNGAWPRSPRCEAICCRPAIPRSGWSSSRAWSRRPCRETPQKTWPCCA